MTLLNKIAVYSYNHLTKLAWFMNAFVATATVAPGREHSLRMSRFTHWPRAEIVAVDTIRKH